MLIMNMTFLAVSFFFFFCPATMHVINNVATDLHIAIDNSLDDNLEENYIL